MTFSSTEQIILILLIFLTISQFINEISRRLIIVGTGSGRLHGDHFLFRLKRTVLEVLFHKRVIGGRFWPGLMHGLVFWGFLVFLIITLDHFALGFNQRILSTELRHTYTLIALPFAILVNIGIVFLFIRRFLLRPEFLGKLSLSSGMVAAFIFLLMVTFIYGEMAPTELAEKVNWWCHAILILAFLILIPRSKHLHLIFAPFNIFLRPLETPYHTPVIIDMDSSEEELDNLLAELPRMTKNQALDIFACVECGRCTEVCPASRGGALLSPKEHFILDLREPLLDNGDTSVLNQINPEAGWECTTCQACTFACPVGNQVEKADEIRRLQVLVEGQVPQEYQRLFMNLQETGNSEGLFGSPLDERFPAWTPDKEYVLWLGCFARYNLDSDFLQSVENFTKILDAAGVTYGILKDEWCSGDPANRLGDKMTFQLLREHNLKLLTSAKKVTSLCPHCLITLSNEYSKYGDVPYEIEHHTQVISRLMEEGKIVVNPGLDGEVSFHDPCNLARIMKEVDAPRKAIQAVAPNFQELPESGVKTLCCGAGGGLWWKKETTGRTHLVRAQQVVDSRVGTIVTACNFCFGMMNQGLAPLSPEGQEPIQVKDVADIIAENLD